MKQFNNEPTQLRRDIDALTNEQRRMFRLPHQGKKEIARHTTKELVGHVRTR